MKQILIVFVLVAAVNAGPWKGGFRARFGIKPFGSFFKLPPTVSEAKEEGWTLRTRNKDLPYQSLTMYCPSPATLCALYDDTENAAGIQIALDQSKFGAVVDMEENGFHTWITDDGTYWASTEYFGSQDYYRTSAETRKAARNPDTLLQTDEVWVTGTNGKLYKIPRDLKGMADADMSEWTQHACIPAMGVHYYYNMTSESECTGKGLFPWFGLYDKNELIGVGFNAYGSYEETGRQWFEWTPAFAVKSTIHNGPQCLYDLTRNPGAQTLHTYFVNSPGLITCLDHLTNLG